MADNDLTVQGIEPNLLANYWRDRNGRYHEKSVEYYVTQGSHGEIVIGRVSRNREDED